VGGDGTENGQFNFPEGIAVDGEGNVYVADTFSNRIQKFKQNEQDPLQYDFVTKWGALGDGDQQFDHPTRGAIDAAGDVFVSDRDNHRVQRFRQNAQNPLQYDLIATIGSEGEDDGELSFPEGLAFDAAGNLYVVDNLNARVQKFAPRNGAPRLRVESTRRTSSQRRERRRSPRRRR
jgi:DNA-binding beta-propeller fold protein YncE